MDATGLVIGGVNPTSFLIDETRQFVGIGGFQLGKPAPIQHQHRQLIVPCGECLQHILTRGRPRSLGVFANFQTHLSCMSPICFGWQC